MNISTENIFDVKGKKAIVTGSTRGLGYGMAEGLWKRGLKSLSSGRLIGYLPLLMILKTEALPATLSKVIWLSAMKFIVFFGKV